MKEQTTENKSATVAGAGKTRLFPKQSGETRDRWSWVERSVWSERLLNRLADSQETRADGLKRKGSIAWKRPKRNGFNPKRKTTDWKAEC